MENAPKARKAYYDKKSKRLIIDLQNGVTVFIPAQLMQIFQNAKADEIADIEIVLNGLYLRWNRLDEDMSVTNLLQGRFGTAKWMAEINSNSETEGELQKKVA